jgi:oxaloacetate decarboxylase alpha subunit
MAHDMVKPTKREKEDRKLHKIPLRFTDTTLRDAHQSLWATRMRTDDILRIVDVIDNVGYYSLECWGGATFDVALRFLRENPWERLRQIKSKAKKTPTQMLLRGQNLVGYRNYADDVVDRFVALACENGMDIFRCFDALNDTRNLEAAIKAVKKHGGHAQGTISYTISPVHTIEKFVQYAREQVALGADSLCIKDMAGILTPIQAERLVSALIKAVKVPVQLHCHASSGMSVATYVEGVRAGAGAIDCAIAPMAGFSSQPPVETMAAIFSETNYYSDLDMEALDRVAKFFDELAPQRRQSSAGNAYIDPGILVHQIPGGMISNFRSQLEKQGALDRLPQVLEEVTKVREDLGWPPLVTPTSQIVGTQAVMNILAGGRYKMVPNEVKDYVRGLYGRSPAPIDPAFVRKILGDEKPIDYRPADKMEPMLPHATDGLDHTLIEHEEDIISYTILPEPSLEYFKWRKLAPEQRPETPADLELKKLKDSSAKPATLPAAAPAPAAVSAPTAAGQLPKMLSPEDYQGLGDMLAKSAGVSFSELTFKKGDFAITVRGTGVAAEPVSAPAAPAPAVAPVAEPAPAAAAPATPAPQPTPAPAPQPEAKAAYASTINSPLVGTFYTTGGPGKPKLVTIGDIVEKGGKVCIVEAMKLFNEIEAPCKCKIVKMLAGEGEGVVKDQPIVGIDPV